MGLLGTGLVKTVRVSSFCVGEQTIAKFCSSEKSICSSEMSINEQILAGGTMSQDQGYITPAVFALSRCTTYDVSAVYVSNYISPVALHTSTRNQLLKPRPHLTASFT